ncbi:MAG: hypothetical protein ACE5DN_02020, partial [Flavobacteriales bacterium]
YARAIDYQDKGLDENAGELLASTLQAHPGFTFARDKLDKIREWLKRAEKEREELIEKETEALLINLNADDPQTGQHINRLWTTFLTAMSYSKMLAVNKRLREQGISEDYKLYGEMSPITFGEMAGYYDFLSLYTLKRYDKALMAGKAFIESHPTSMYFSSVKMNMALAIKELQERKSGKAAIDKAQQISQFETYANAFSRLSGFGRMDYLTPTQYKELRALYQRRILGFGEDAMKNYVANGGEYADALFEFKMAAALFLDTALMDDIAAKSKKVYSGTSLEDEAYRIAEWVESKKKTIAKHRKEADGLRTLMKSDREEDVKKMTQKIRVLVKCREWDAIMHICDAFHKLPVRDKRAYEYKVLALAHLHRFDEAEQTVADYATDKDLIGDDPAGHEREVRDMKKLISEAREQALGYKLGYFTLPLYKNRADTFKNHHLYAEEASVRRQIVDRLEPDEQEGSLQLYLLVNACSNAGLFKQAREAGQELLRKYPGSSYATGLDYTLKFMPE